ncbi:unnamed protein product [Cuscuta campestris]|uniref:RNase H type-1 domain-containing protein n=1 Tax=Cuscuta campestris TaxID=132261 RepID=A0A484MZU2_9ASTE|nr:unnamed protein product [Cuscuta campestris]
MSKLLKTLKKGFSSLGASSSNSNSKFPKGAGDFEDYFKTEIKPLLIERYSKYPQPPSYVLPKDSFVQGYLRCPPKYRTFLLDALERKLMAVEDDGGSLPWNPQSIPKTRGPTKVMVSIPRRIEDGWKVIHVDYAYCPSNGGGIGAVIFDSPATPGCIPDHICQHSSTSPSDVVLGEGEAFIEALLKARADGARKVWCVSDCNAIVDYINGNRQAPEKHLETVLNINALLERFEDFEVVHLYRERNSAADWLAVAGRNRGGLSKVSGEEIEEYNHLVASLMAQEPCFPIRF